MNMGLLQEEEGFELQATMFIATTAVKWGILLEIVLKGNMR